jgi:hypothetical protein
MKKRFNRLWKSGMDTFSNQNDLVLEHSCAGRVQNALTFIVIIICLGLWITFFVTVKDRLFTGTLSGNILTNLTCLTFFGGLVLAIFVGALAGNFLRRIFWKWLIRRSKRS